MTSTRDQNNDWSILSPVGGVGPESDHYVKHGQCSPAPPTRGQSPTTLIRLQRHRVTHKPHIVHLQLELGAAQIFGHREQVGQGLVRQPV